MSVSAFEVPVNAERPMVYARNGEEMLVWPDKVNPKKFPRSCGSIMRRRAQGMCYNVNSHWVSTLVIYDFKWRGLK